MTQGNPALYAVGMTTLDNETLQWIIDNIGYSEDSFQRPQHNTLSFRDGNYFKDYILYTPTDIREWLADLMHRTWFEFMIDGKPDNGDKDRMPTHIKVTCSCGDFEEVQEIVMPWEGHEAVMGRIAGEHVSEAKKAILSRWEWDES